MIRQIQAMYLVRSRLLFQQIQDSRERQGFQQRQLHLNFYRRVLRHRHRRHHGHLLLVRW